MQQDMQHRLTFIATAVIKWLLRYCFASIQSLGSPADGEEGLAATLGLEADLLENGALQSDEQHPVP